MQSQRREDTEPERRLRSSLHRKGLRFRKNYVPEESFRCRADIVFLSAKVCVFVDGCYWHGCPDHFSLPQTNKEWWEEKIEGNVRRDARQSRELRQRGWTVLRVWEHEIIGEELEAVIERVMQAVRGSEEVSV